MEIRYIDSVFAVQSDGKALLMITIPQENKHLYDEIQALENDKLKVMTIKYHREKRSLDANAFAWVLIDKIAKKLGSSDDEIYTEMLRKYGIKDYVAALPQAEEVLKKVYRVVEPIKDTNINGTPAKTFKLVRGSSTYDSLEMSQFINGIVEEAKALGIEILTPDELNQMLERWKV